MSQRLIITAPGDSGGSFARSWSKVTKVFEGYFPDYNGDYSVYRSFCSSRLPFHLPFSFDSSTAESLARELTAVGCEVKVVPAGD